MKLKVCGMKYAENIMEVAALHPDFMGFIFYPHSKRYVGEHFDLKKIKAFPKEVKKVGVFVNAEEQFIRFMVKRNDLDYVQLHGMESPAYCERLSYEIKIIKAFGIHPHFDFHSLKKYKPHCSYFLFDTKISSFGGSGKQFDWNILNQYDLDIPYFLSGGVGMGSIADLKQQHPFAIDVNSKFETDPGLKDTDLLQEFLAIIHA
ncbi:MAG: phosphoribosylanthranilate isomerase [Chitinophagales bacterium]|nr:phosphoribosylanthranilate isomerase [Chitinophagales bacterium]